MGGVSAKPGFVKGLGTNVLKNATIQAKTLFWDIRQPFFIDTYENSGIHIFKNSAFDRINSADLLRTE